MKEVLIIFFEKRRKENGYFELNKNIRHIGGALLRKGKVKPLLVGGD